MSEKKIELISKKNNSFEINEEALKFLLSLKSQKLFIISVNGPSHFSLCNEIISKNVFDQNEKNEENIYIWNKPIYLNKDYKILIFDYKSRKNNNLFLLNILIANYFLYNAKGVLNDENVKKYVDDINIKELINFKNNTYMPEVFLINENKTKEEIKNIFENNSEFKKSDLNNGLYKVIKYLQFKNVKNLINSITNELSCSNNKKCFNGESLFGLIQNFINSLNHSEKIDINLSYENTLLNNARNEFNKIFEDYKSNLYKKIEYPITFQTINKINTELINNYIT